MLGRQVGSRRPDLDLLVDAASDNVGGPRNGPDALIVRALCSLTNRVLGTLSGLERERERSQRGTERYHRVCGERSSEQRNNEMLIWVLRAVYLADWVTEQIEATSIYRSNKIYIL